MKRRVNYSGAEIAAALRAAVSRCTAWAQAEHPDDVSLRYARELGSLQAFVTSIADRAEEGSERLLYISPSESEAQP